MRRVFPSPATAGAVTAAGSSGVRYDMTRTMKYGSMPLLLTVWAVLGAADPLPKDSAYRGIWYANQPTGDEYAFKYSGGLATYPANHVPIAIYAPTANKTFFVYGGAAPGSNTALVEMVSYYDHATRQSPPPTILMDKHTSDAHDNPVIALDETGHVWVFASAHGTARPAYIFRSDQPHSVDRFTRILETNFSYPQPWYIAGKGFLFLHTRYAGGRGLYWQTSRDGIAWSAPRQLAHIQEGHYQVSWPRGNRVGTAFNYHPRAFQGDPSRSGLNWRTNLYYIETEDMGETWRSASGEVLSTPVTEVNNPAVAIECESRGELVYTCDLNFDEKGRPVILYIAARHWRPGPDTGPREWRLAHWSGAAWNVYSICPADHNYDVGSLYIEPGTWRLLAPTEPGPQPYGAGGEIVVWESTDEGRTWAPIRPITRNSPLNHTYVRRPVDARADFYAFWADGNPRAESPSHLYYLDAGDWSVHQMRPGSVPRGGTAASP